MEVSSNFDEFGLDCFGLSFYERQVHKLLPEYAAYVAPLSVKVGTDQFTTDPASSYPRRQSCEKIAGLRHRHQRWLSRFENHWRQRPLSRQATTNPNSFTASPGGRKRKQRILFLRLRLAKGEGEGRSFSPLSQQLLECRRRIRRPVAILDDYWAGDLEVVRHCKWSFCGAASRHDDCIARDDQRAFI